MAKASDVAEFYIAMYEDSEDRMTNLRINRFLYFAQGWCIARLGRPLFDEEIQAWRYGPVIPSVYETYKVCGRNPVECIEKDDYLDAFSSDEIDLMIDVAMEYGRFSTSALASISHAEGTPWAETYDPEQPGKAIPVESMGRYFSGMPPIARHSAADNPRIERYRSPFPDGRIVLPADYDD